MRDFSWNYFFNTGQIDAYLLIKEFEAAMNTKECEGDSSNLSCYIEK